MFAVKLISQSPLERGFSLHGDETPMAAAGCPGRAVRWFVIQLVVSGDPQGPGAPPPLPPA